MRTHFTLTKLQWNYPSSHHGIPLIWKMALPKVSSSFFAIHFTCVHHSNAILFVKFISVLILCFCFGFDFGPVCPYEAISARQSYGHLTVISEKNRMKVLVVNSGKSRNCCCFSLHRIFFHRGMLFIYEKTCKQKSSCFLMMHQKRKQNTSVFLCVICKWLYRFKEKKYGEKYRKCWHGIQWN